MSQPLRSRSDLTLPMKDSPDAEMTDKLRELIQQWRAEQRGRYERIEHFARIALGEAPTGAPPLQDPELYFWPGLESHPFHDRAVPWMAELEAAYPIISAELKGKKISVPEGRLADVAPTILQLLNLPQPREMTGQSLLAAYAGK